VPSHPHHICLPLLSRKALSTLQLWTRSLIVPSTMPVDRDWLAGLPEVEDASDWEATMDRNFMDFTRFGGGDLDSENVLVDDNDMFPMPDEARVATAGTPAYPEPAATNQVASAGNHGVQVAPPSKSSSSVDGSEATERLPESDAQSTVSSGVNSNSTERPHKGKRAEKKALPAVALVCHICEGTPTFSDLSHLLTHCSSRAHTKRHFDMKARGLTDESAANKLRTYKTWYEANQIGPMINRRLVEKDAKDRVRKMETAKRNSSNPPSKKRKMETKAPFTSSKQGKQVRNPATEQPRLPPALPLEPAPAFGNLASLPFHMDANSVSAASDSHPIQPSTSNTQLPEMASMATQGYEDLPIPGLESPNGSVFAPSENGVEYADVVEEEDERQPVLKGKYWPGMAIFDSASEKDRRRRNQRKDASVLQKMQRSSASIRTTMMVLDSNFDHSSDRDVYDEPSCDEATPSKKPSSAAKRKYTPRKSKGGTKAKNTSRVKPEPRTPRAARTNNLIAPQTSGPRRATRGSAARAQAEIARMAQNELEDRFEDPADSDNESLRPALKRSASDASQDRDTSARPSTAGISSDGNVSLSNNDVFQDPDVGSAAAMNHALGGHGHARFPRRNRVPLQALSRNGPPIASPNISSPTPSSKPMPLSFTGKENNSVFKQGMMGQHGQNMGGQGMMYSNMGMQGMPRTVWNGNVGGQNPYGYGYQSAFPDPMMFGSGAGAHPPSNLMQPQLNGMYHDDLQHNMFQPHAAVNDGQHWQHNGNDLAGNHGGQGLASLGPNWMGHASGASGYDDDQQTVHYHDN
ncbi:hypothetical protein F5X68DRAFT_252599, partial [Plectosphaerella plurivora]